MKKTQLQEKVRKIDELIKAEYGKNVILDGIVDHEKYLNAKFKILWILKEPHDKGGQQEWSMRDLIKDAKYSEGLNPDMKYTFTNIIYSTYSIFNNFVSWNEMDYMEDKPEMIEYLQKIALINIKKLPAGSSSKDNEIQSAYQKYRSIILKQIETFEPNIIIGGNTIKYIQEDLELSKFPKIEKDLIWYYLLDDKIVIDAYHPASRINNEQYCNSIIDAVKEWSNNKNNL